jgi:cation transport ATPase
MRDAQSALPASLCLGLDCCKAACMMQGKMRLVGTNTAEGQDESELLRLAAAVEGSTRHPLADAVLLAANKANLQVMWNLCGMTAGFVGHSLQYCCWS